MDEGKLSEFWDERVSTLPIKEAAISILQTTKGNAKLQSRDMI